MNLHDWIDELSDLLDVEAEADEGLLNDLSLVAHDNVHPAAGAVTAYLLGVAAGAREAGPEAVEAMAAQAQALAEAWDRPAGADVDADEEADHEVDDELQSIDDLDFEADDEDVDEDVEDEDVEAAQGEGAEEEATV